jgi:hypothetical protein
LGIRVKIYFKLNKDKNTDIAVARHMIEEHGRSVEEHGKRVRDVKSESLMIKKI